MKRTHAVFVWFLVFQLAFPVLAEEQAVRMDLSDCVDYALQHNPDLRMDAAGSNEALALRKSARGSFGPVFSTEGNIIRWDSASEMQLGGDGEALDLSAIPPEFITALSPLLESMGQPITTREQWIGGISVTVTQPLTNLWTIAEAYNMADCGVDAAALKQTVTRNTVITQVVQTYYRRLQVARHLEIAEKSQEQLQAHVDKAKLFFEQGLIPESEYLKALVGLAKVQEGVIKARSGVQLAAAYLGNLLGLPAGQVVDPVESEADTSYQPDCELSQCQSAAETGRPEIRMINARIGAAGAGKRLAISQMLPSLALSGSYMYDEGSKFQEETSWFVGGFLTWNFWEWGATYYQIDAADARLSRARIGREKMIDYIRLEVKQAYLKLKEARESLAVAGAGIEHATEALRIENIRFEQHVATSTDVLDAEAMFTDTKNRQTAAQYDFLIAVAAFEKAMGRPSFSVLQAGVRK